MSRTRVVNFGEDGSMRLLGMAIDVFLAVIGLGLFVYGDLAVHRTARIVGVIVTTVAVVVAAILASMREREG
jgi:FtsH-binding integral membrane protein